MKKKFFKERLIAWCTLSVFTLVIIFEEKIPAYGIILPLVGAIVIFFSFKNLPIISIFPTVSSYIKKKKEDREWMNLIERENMYISLLSSFDIFLGGFLVYALRLLINRHLVKYFEYESVSMFFLIILILIIILIIRINLHNILRLTDFGKKHSTLMNRFPSDDRSRYSKEISMIQRVNLVMGAGVFDFITLFYSFLLEVRNSIMAISYILLPRKRYAINNKDLSLEDRIYQISLRYSGEFKRYLYVSYIGDVGFIFMILIVALADFGNKFQLLNTIIWATPLIIALYCAFAMRRSETTKHRLSPLFYITGVLLPCVGMLFMLKYPQSNPLVEIIRATPLAKDFFRAGVSGFMGTFFKAFLFPVTKFSKFSIPFLLGVFFLEYFILRIPAYRADYEGRYLKYYFFRESTNYFYFLFVVSLTFYIVHLQYPFLEELILWGYIPIRKEISILSYWTILLTGETGGWIVYIPFIVAIFFLLFHRINKSEERAYEDRTGRSVPNFWKDLPDKEEDRYWFRINRYRHYFEYLIYILSIIVLFSWATGRMIKTKKELVELDEKFAQFGDVYMYKWGITFDVEFKRNVQKGLSKDVLNKYIKAVKSSKNVSLIWALLDCVWYMTSEDYEVIKPVLLEMAKDEENFMRKEIVIYIISKEIKESEGDNEKIPEDLLKILSYIGNNIEHRDMKSLKWQINMWARKEQTLKQAMDSIFGNKSK